MGRQKKKSRSLQSFETLGGNENRFIGVNYTLYFHSSYMSLTDKQQKLYELCPIQYDTKREGIYS